MLRVSINFTGRMFEIFEGYIVVETYAIPYCGGEDCITIHEYLMRSGYFAASPCLPSTAFSIDVLQSYSIPNRQANYPVAAFREGLVAGLLRHGFCFSAKIPFKNQLPEAVTWFNALQHQLKQTEISMLQEAEKSIPQSLDNISDSELRPGLSHWRLRQLCPACFGSRQWGRAAEKDPDVQVAIDGNFTHRRYKSVPEDPPIVESHHLEMWLTPEELEAAQSHMAEKSHIPLSGDRQEARVPTGSLDECEKSHRAARDRGDGSESDLYASKGIMAMVCRHDVPLFLCDITTPGEQRFYAIALIQKLASMLPSHASIGCLYDIACLLDRSISKVKSNYYIYLKCDMYPWQHNLIPDIAPRLSLATAAFHAYAHQFCCQIVFNPRKRVGFGMTNGEGNERLWALCKDTISSERITAVCFTLAWHFFFALSVCMIDECN
jgi:hypothetical protein